MRKWVKRLSLSVVALAALFGIGLTIQLHTGNFHEVVPNELYRSGQLTGEELESYAKQHHIKSIINLRGENENAEWYIQEIAVSKKLGIAHTNYAMKAANELSDAQVAELISLMKNAPKPILIHCRAGADRTGLASALYIAAISKGSEWDADYQLSLRYGHVSLWFTQAAAMSRTFERVEHTFGYSGS